MNKVMKVLLRCYRVIENLHRGNETIGGSASYKYFTDFLGEPEECREPLDIILDLLNVPKESENYCRDWHTDLLLDYVDGKHTEEELIYLISE